MNNNWYYHPKDWSTAELMSYMHYELHMSADRIAAYTREEMVDLVAKDEIDKE